MGKFVKWFKEIGIDDVAEVGGKNASLGEMYRTLTQEGVRVPNGFAVTADAYRYLLEYNGVWRKLHELLDGLDPDDVKQLQERGAASRRLIQECKIPDDLKEEILNGYEELKREYGEDLSLAVRSSARRWCVPTKGPAA